MRSLKRILQSWLSAGVVACIIGGGSYLLIEKVLAELYTATSSVYVVIGAAAFFVLPSTLLNWLYDMQGHVQTQRDWMKSPRGLIGKVGYVFTGALALWGLLSVGLFLAALVISGLMSLGQAAWST